MNINIKKCDITKNVPNITGVLNDVGSFFDSLRDNLETLASLSPQQRSNLFLEPPTVVHATSSGKLINYRESEKVGI